MSRVERFGGVIAALLGLGGCKSCNEPIVNAGTDAESAVAAESIDPRGDRAADLLLRDGGVAPECTGVDVALARAVVEPRCAIPLAESKRLRAALEADGGGASDLEQRATRADDGSIVVKIVNKGTRALALPVSWHPKLAAFTALAEDSTHALYELASPSFEVHAGAGPERAHLARIILPPGGVASAHVGIVPNVVRRLDKPCADAGSGEDGGACPVSLASGAYTLHVGQLVSDVETGPPATLAWDLRK